ncbi:A-kinase anchor protein 9 isoform X2 [Thalassophryne amazonica]|uniref:A-kinase anchor protein 9 isoform X2 n=1 Tax=Thalassophryne amazonica TaxID=390379 RepID=UPI001471F75E|nr:A-kinase anchor protein 9 isoform X2 [Thalassophryne amazonica]
MSKRRWVEFKICQTISCTAPVKRRQRTASTSAAAATETAVMEDEERQKKLEAGKAKLAEYRQRKAHTDSQKKQKKKKKKKPADDLEEDWPGRVEAVPDQSAGGDNVSGGERYGSQRPKKDPPTAEFTFTRTLHSGDTVKHDQTYTIEPESEVSTTAEDYSSEVNGCHDVSENLLKSSMDLIWEEVEHLRQGTQDGTIQDMEDALAGKNQAEEELKQDFEEYRTAFAAEEVQQLQDFEAALKQRDGIITQLTTNLQQAREEKDEIMKEFLELTEQSQKLQIQFQQLQAGETLRNTSHSSTAADLLLARQQLIQYQQQLEEMNVEIRKYQESNNKQLEEISQLQQNLREMEILGRSSEESFTQKINEKDLLIAEQEKIITRQEQSVTELKMADESFHQTMQEKQKLVDEQTAIISEHEQSLTLLRDELVRLGRTAEDDIIHKSHKDQIIAEQEGVISERDCCITQLQDELESSEKRLRDLHQRMAAGELELERCLDELESLKCDLNSSKSETESCKLELENVQKELEIYKNELANSKQKERMSSNEIMQLMGTVEELQKRNHQGMLSEGDLIQKMQEETGKKLEFLRAELDEMYGQQIVQMKQELNLKHAADMEEMAAHHQTELELIKAQSLSHTSNVGTVEAETLNATIKELQVALDQSEEMHDKTRHELSKVSREKLGLQSKVEELLRDLSSAKEEMELASSNLISQESQDELQHLQDSLSNLQCQLAAFHENTKEAEAKHESEVTNYKIKLEMLEREKDAVLDRMAESQEAELERLRTQLLFSHEEELTVLRKALQRENCQNAENLLQEAAVKQERVLNELRTGYEEQLYLLQREKESAATERDELLHQIQALKEDRNQVLDDSKAHEAVQQLHELRLELVELRKQERKQADIENEIQTLLLKGEVLENKAKEQEQCWQNKFKEWELEKASLEKSTMALKEELCSKNMEIETLEAQRKELQQQIAHLCDEAEKQRTTFSFAEKNFEVNYQELKEEYTCLVTAKAQLEKTLKQTFEFEAKIASLQSQIQEVEGSSTGIRVEETSADSKALTEKDATELMEKLNVTVGEKESLAVKLSEVTEQLMCTENKVGQLEEELLTLRRENKKVIAQNDSLVKELDKEQQIMREQRRGQAAQRKAKLQQEKQPIEPVALVCSVGDHHLQIQSLQGEVEALQSLLRAAEAEKDSIRQTLELQRLKQTPSPAAVQSSGEAPVEGRSSLQKSSGSSRRKRRQRLKQERKLFGTDCADSREETQREEEEEDEEEALVEEETATSAAEPEMQSRIQRQVLSCSQESAGREDSTDGYQGDRNREHINKQMRSHAASCHMEAALNPEAEEETTQHGECRLQMEAQRISLSQIHAAQLELLQEETDYYTQSPKLKEDHNQDEPKIFKYQKLLEAVSEESREIVLSLQNMLGEELSENVDSASRQLSSVETPETSESNSVLLRARELYRDLRQVKARIEQEYNQLLQLQSVLRADENKMAELQRTYNELKSSSEKEIADLHVQVASFSSSASKDLENPAGAQSPSLSVQLQRQHAEAQEKQLQLEESHRQEMDRLRAHYQQQAMETEQRYTTELSMLEQQLQEVTATESYNRVTESASEKMEVQTEEQKALSEESLKGGAGLLWSTRTVGLTAQLQALRKALYNKYMQEVATLKEQHSKELRRLKEQREQERKAGERLQEKAEASKVEHDADSFNKSGCSTESLGTKEQVPLEEKQHWEKVEEEVAKVIVQMSVQFAQQTELAQASRRACQTSTSMQTERDEAVADEKEACTPRVSPTSGVWMEEEEEALEKELEERNAEIEKLKGELQNARSRHQVLKHSGAGQQEVEEEEDPGELGSKQAGQPNPSSQDDGESADKDILPAERNLLRKTNEKLCQVLVDVLKTTAAAEETIGLHMQSLCDTSSGHQQTASPQSTTQRVTRVNTEPVRPHSAESCHSSQTVAADVSVGSGEADADEDLEMSQQVMDSLLLGVGSQLENEEYLMSISSRLQTALEKMLMTITDTTNQLEHARVTQTELMRESFRHNQEIKDLLQKQEELQERVLEEARAREHLAQELQRAEGLIDGYTGERAALEEQLRQKEEFQLSLEQELQVTSSRLHELEQERLQMQQERELLGRQQEVMKEHAGPRELRLVEAAMVAAPEADLLEETEKLMKEKVEVQLQAEKESTDLLKQVKLLEVELEEQVNRVIELEHAQKTEGGDLRQQIQALEKQLEKNRRFLDEQAVDREHERDFFQQEIQKLEQQLKSPQKLQAVSEQRNKEVEQLTAQLKEKADWCSELLLSSEQLRRELGERDEEIDKLESRIRELEQALLASAESLEKVEQKKQHASFTDATHSTLEAQLQTEREALERKEKEICNLEEQLEQFREELENKSEEVQLLHMQLEIQRKELSSQQQYLEMRDSMIQVMEDKDREIALLNEQITKLQHMETSSDNKEIDARDELIKELESQVECMRSEQERLKVNNVEELDQLNAVIDKLQQELANIEQKQTAEEDDESKSRESGPCQEEYDDMKHRMDLASKELVALQTEHSKLREMYQQLQESSAAFAESEKSGSLERELIEVLREKNAHLVVLQAEVQALEQSATSRVEELTLRIQELEDLVGEKDYELARCRLLAEQTQSQAGGLQTKVSSLEENLSERMAAAIVSQATLEAFQQQASQGSEKDLHRPVEPQVVDFDNFTIPQLDFSNLGQARQAPTGKVVHLTQKLRELEVGLSGMQKDQELQKQLLSSSEEEVMEYERRLAVLMDLLSQMKRKTTQRTTLFVESMSADGQPPVSELLQELQEVRDEASTTEEQLSNYKENCSRLQEELKEKTATMERLKDQPQRVLSGSSEEGKISELRKELAKAQNEAATTKEELNSFRESCEKLQELLQEREITIAHLKDELNQHVTAKDDGASMMELLQELQELRKDGSTTKEELSSSKQHIEKLVNDLQVREDSICKLREELEEVSKTMDSTKEELCSSKQHIEKLENDVQVREFSICKLREELEEVRKTMDAIKEELCTSKQHSEKLEGDVQVRELSICKLREELEEIGKTMDATKEELCRSKQHSEKLEDDVQVRELSICKLREELEEVIQTVDATKEELHSSRQHAEQLQEDLQEQEVSLCNLKEELQEVRKNMDTTKEELNSSRQQNEKLQNDLQTREVSVSNLNKELQEARTALTKATDLASKSPSPSPQIHSSASSASTIQPKRKGGKQLTVKGSSAKDKPSVSRKTSSSSSQSSSKIPSPVQNSFSERHRVAVTDSFTQTDAVQMSDLGPDNKPAPTTTKEEMDEVIGEFQEKIVQMQELHAAEILDMEARHISESEILRRDTQALEDECKALKAIIDKLRSGEGPLSRPDRPASLFKDGYTSDSSSDYSQRTGYDLPSLQQEFRTTPEGARREPDDPLPDRIKTLLREVHQEGMQVLSLSELPLSEGEPTSQLHIQGWAKERQDLLANVEALKDLITQMKKDGETQASDTADWRQELLDAVRLVFVRERSILKNALYSQLDLLDTSDAIIHLNHLERQLAEQDAEHREAMSTLHTAERSSLISEIQQLRNQLQQLHQGAKPVVSMPGESSVQEQRGGGAAEANRLLVEELKCELSQTKLELETTLKAQHKYLKELDTLRSEVSQKAAEVDTLNDQLSDEKKRIRELQWTVEREKCRTGRSEESKREELEDLHLTVEELKSHVAQLTSALEQERQDSSQLALQADQELLNLRRHLQELQVQLETERAKAQEMSIALAREQELRQRGTSKEEQVEEDRSGLNEEGSLLERMQRELDDKHTQVVHVLSQLEAQRLEVIRKEAQLTSVSQGSRRDQEALLEVRSQLENFETRLSEAQEQLERELERSRRLQNEKEQLEERLVHLDGQRGGGGSDEGGALHSDNHNVGWRSDPTDRTKDWVFEQKSRNDPSVSLSMPTHLEITQSGHIGGSGQGHHRMVDKLHLISSKIHNITSKTPGSLTTEVNSEDLTWVQSSIDEVITMLQQFQSVPVAERFSLLAGGSSSSLTERLLRQNAELTGFVSRLTEEKNDLRNHTLHLEEELRRYRQAGLGSGGGLSSRRGILTGDSAGLLLSQEREAWTREKTRLEKSLHAVQAQVARLRGEIRTNMLREITGPEADNAALKRMYGKYLRSESFRKALIYQKKYLLLLLGGFQECEEATLSLLCRMGGRPSLTAMDSGSQRRRALMRFRSAVRVSIALSRMRFLVKRWQRATGTSSVTSGAISKNAAGQAMGTDVRDSPYLHPRSVEVYRERGGGGVSSSRGRSGRESPRSACSLHHRFHAASDHGALTCSHLQSYDPDRALTDYISRLEALQRRLGSVTSGASSYAHLHFGLRR